MSETKSKNTLVHDALILFAITIVAAIALGFVYEITKDPIEAAEAQAKIDAYKAVFPDMDSTYDAPNRDLAIYQAMIDEDSELEGTTIDEVLEARDASGSHLGWVMTLTNSKGYGGDITITIGITDQPGPDMTCTLNGIEFLSISETAGLGMKAKNDDFKDQFIGAEVNRYSLTKRNISGDTEIDAISSATITTTAVTRAVDAGLLIGQYLLALSSY